MPKLLVDTATKKEVNQLRTKVYQYLNDKNQTIEKLANKIKMNNNTLYSKIHGLSAMRKIEYNEILEVIS